MSYNFSLEELDQAADLIHGFMPPTPQYNWPLLSRRTGAEVFVKHEKTVTSNQISYMLTFLL